MSHCVRRVLRWWRGSSLALDRPAGPNQWSQLVCMCLYISLCFARLLCYAMLWPGLIIWAYYTLLALYWAKLWVFLGVIHINPQQTASDGNVYRRNAIAMHALMRCCKFMCRPAKPKGTWTAHWGLSLQRCATNEMRKVCTLFIFGDRTLIRDTRIAFDNIAAPAAAANHALFPHMYVPALFWSNIVSMHCCNHHHMTQHIYAVLRNEMSYNV